MPLPAGREQITTCQRATWWALEARPGSACPGEGMWAPLQNQNGKGQLLGPHTPPLPSVSLPAPNPRDSSRTHSPRSCPWHTTASCTASLAHLRTGHLLTECTHSHTCTRACAHSQLCAHLHKATHTHRDSMHGVRVHTGLVHSHPHACTHLLTPCAHSHAHWSRLQDHSSVPAAHTATAAVLCFCSRARRALVEAGGACSRGSPGSLGSPLRTG